MIVTLYTKHGCGICEQAENHLRAVQRLIQFQLEVVYIEEDPVLLDRLGDRVPVVYVDGREVAAAPIDTAVVEAALSA